MGLSVADLATLVTLNSLGPSNYDSAKCPAMMSVLLDSVRLPEMLKCTVPNCWVWQ